jgi:signal transduction histidine kinase
MTTRGPAAAQAERIAGVVFVGSRAGQLAFSALMVANDRARFASVRNQVAILTAATAESIWLSCRVVRAGGYDDGLARWVDTLTSSAALLASHRGLRAGAAPWAKNIAIGSAIGAGSSRSAAGAAASLAVLGGAAFAVGTRRTGRDAHVAGAALAANDVISWTGMSIAARRYLAAHRDYARERDALDALVVERSAALAAQEERARQHEALHRVTIDVLARIAETTDVGTEPVALARHEAGRLRHALRSDGRLPAGLHDELRAIADYFAPRVRVDLVTAELDGDPGPAATEALAGAVRQALDAAADLGRAERAVVRAYRGEDGVRVSVRDHGAGFDADADGDYARRLRAIPGASVWSAPGSGVRVDIAAPAAPQVHQDGPPSAHESGRAVRRWLRAGSSAQFRLLPPEETRRGYRTMLAPVLTWRVTGLATGAASLAGGWRRFRHRGLAVAQLAVGVAESAWLARRLYRLDRWHDPDAGVVDALTAMAILEAGRANLAPPDRVTWINWAPWSFATSAISAQSMADHAVARRLAGGLAISAVHAVQGPRASDALANTVAHASISAGARLLATQIRAGAVRLSRARDAAVEQQRLLAAARERAAQLRLLHDSAVQTLEAIAAGRYGDAGAVRERARAEAELLTRELARAAGPVTALGEELVRVVAEHTRRGLDVAVDVQATRQPPADVVVALAAACHEALTNVAKHARTSAATVGVRGNGRGLILFVEDGGAGFDPELSPRGFGLAHSIHERLRDVGGSAVVTSSPGNGTRVELRWPA